MTFGVSHKSDADFDLGLSAIAQNVMLSFQNIGDGQVQLQWVSGVSLQATNLTGPWTTNIAATSPYSVIPIEPQMFYKIEAQ